MKKKKILNIEVTPYDTTNSSYEAASRACGEGGCDSCNGGLPD